MESTEEVLNRLVDAIATAFRVGPEEIAVDADLFDQAGFTIRQRILDSLELVEMVTAAEEALGVELEGLMESSDALTLRQVAEFAAPTITAASVVSEEA